jgi:hypothetical protein
MVMLVELWQPLEMTCWICWGAWMQQQQQYRGYQGLGRVQEEDQQQEEGRMHWRTCLGWVQGHQQEVLQAAVALRVEQMCWIC